MKGVWLSVALLASLAGSAGATGVASWTCKDFSTLPEEARRGVSLGYVMGWMGAAAMTTELGASLEQEDVRNAGKAAEVIAGGIGNDSLFSQVASRCDGKPELSLITALRGSLIELAKRRRSQN